MKNSKVLKSSVLDERSMMIRSLVAEGINKVFDSYLRSRKASSDAFFFAVG